MQKPGLLFSIPNSSHGAFGGPLVFSVTGVNFSDFIPSITGVSTFFAVDILGAIGNTGLVSLGVPAGLLG